LSASYLFQPLSQYEERIFVFMAVNAFGNTGAGSYPAISAKGTDAPPMGFKRLK